MMKTSREQAGAYPYTRGIYPMMYRERLWTMRQYAGSGTARDTNRRLRRLLSQGQTGLSVAFDLPTQLGLDPDDERAAGEVGTCGASIPTMSEFDTMLSGIPFRQASLSMTVNATAPALFAMAAATAAKRGTPPEELRGTIQNDMLKEYAARNLYVFPPEPALRMAVDVMEYCCRHYPRWHPVSVSGYHIREAGADAAQEIGFALSNGITYIEELLRRGIDIDSIAPRMSFFFSAGCDVLEEAAKFRAARRLWARLMRERFHPRNPDSCKMKFHAQTAGSALTAVQPEHNAIRIALQALAAVLGGAQSLHTNAKDEGLRLPTASSSLLALRTQQIIACESGLADRIDPLGGAYEIEAMTDRLEAEAEQWIASVERQGGALQAVRTGSIQSWIRASAFRDYQAVTGGERIVVGLNRWEEDRPAPAGSGRRQAAKPAVNEADIAATLHRARSSRSETDAARAMNELLHAAEGGHNIMPTMLEAVRSGCTIGEIYGSLEPLFGSYRDADQALIFIAKEEHADGPTSADYCADCEGRIGRP